MLSAAFTALAGSLYLLMFGFIDPESGFGILISVKMVVMAALGGAGPALRPAGLGALILVPLEELSNSYLGGAGAGLTFVVYGAIIVHHRPLPAERPDGASARLRRAPPNRASGTTMLLEARNVTKAFGAFKACRRCVGRLQEGDILGLIGPNGAGKSTFFNCLAGDLPDRGHGPLRSGRRDALPRRRRARGSGLPAPFRCR